MSGVEGVGDRGIDFDMPSVERSRDSEASLDTWSRAERERPITRTSTVCNSGPMLHLNLSNTGHSVQCHLYSRTRKKKSLQRLNSMLRSQFLITIANNESSCNPFPIRKTGIVRTDITVLRPD